VNDYGLHWFTFDPHENYHYCGVEDIYIMTIRVRHAATGEFIHVVTAGLRTTFPKEHLAEVDLPVVESDIDLAPLILNVMLAMVNDVS
jgi:hypothetical protein